MPTTTTAAPARKKRRKKKQPVEAKEETRVTFQESFTKDLRTHLSDLDSTFVERKGALSCIALSLLTSNNFLFVGDPGTAKTALIEKFLTAFEGEYFNALCGSFTTLDELVGPPDIDKFQKGEWGRVVEGRIPTCRFAFLDEVMKANDGTVNSLLKILNEREFEGESIPLHMVGSATNWPEVRQRTEKVEALYDRFVLRLHIEAVKDDSLVDMFRAGAAVADFQPSVRFDYADVVRACEEVKTVKIGDAIYEKLKEVIQRLAKDDVKVSNRRAVKALRILQASAWLSGRDEVSLNDFPAMRFVFWTNEIDIPVIETICEAIDKQAIKECVDKIAAIRATYAKLKRDKREARLTRASQVLRDMTKTGKEIKVELESGKFTEEGAEKVNSEMKKLKADFIEFRDEVKRELDLETEDE